MIILKGSPNGPNAAAKPMDADAVDLRCVFLLHGYTWLKRSHVTKRVEILCKNHLESRMEKDCLVILKGENSNQVQSRRRCSLHKMKESWSAARPISAPWMSRVLPPSLLSMASSGWPETIHSKLTRHFSTRPNNQNCAEVLQQQLYHTTHYICNHDRLISWQCSNDSMPILPAYSQLRPHVYPWTASFQVSSTRFGSFPSLCLATKRTTAPRTALLVSNAASELCTSLARASWTYGEGAWSPEQRSLWLQGTGKRSNSNLNVSWIRMYTFRTYNELTLYIYIYTNPHCSLRSFSAPLELSAKWNRLLHPMTKTTKVQCHGEVGGWTKGCIRQPCVWRVYQWKPTRYTLTHTAACALFQLPWSYLQNETASSIQWQKPLRSNVTHHPCAPLWQSRVEAA